MGKTYTIIPEWFRRTDNLGHRLSTWCKRVSDEEVLCSVCDKKIYCSKKGFAALTQHVSTLVHKENAAVKLADTQMLLKPHLPEDLAGELVHIDKSAVVPLQPEGNSVLQLFSCKEAVARAEIIWALKSVQCNMAASSCDDLNDVFSAMFPGSVSGNFHLGRTKLSYLITEALGPYFRKEFLNDARQSYYSLLYDETTNNADKKELQFVIRFWSEEDKQIVCKHLQTVILGHARADDILQQIRTALNSAGLLPRKLLMLGSDGPNVNKKIWRLLNNELIEERGQGLLNIGTCNLHIVHNAFLRGMEEFGDAACELISDIYHFFKKFPARWDDYEKLQVKKNVPKHRFIKHVSSRWLTVRPACDRILEQWPAIEQYFLVFIPANEKKLMQTEKYKRIIKLLKYVDIKVELSFVIESSQLFSTFVEFFQRSEPLIHVLYSELNNILKKIVGRICKPNVIDPCEIITAEHLLKASKIDCGVRTTEQIASLDEKSRSAVFHKIQRHLMASYNYLVQKDVFEKEKLLSCFQCLQGNEISNIKSLKSVAEIAKALSFIGINDLSVKDEWRLLQSEVTIPDAEIRIDHFWRDIIYQKTALGGLKYPALSKLVKASLCLSHGNSDVERGFSVSRRVLAEDKASMSERILNDRLTVRDALKKYKNVSQVPITKQLLNLSYGAHKAHELYLEEQKRLKEQSLKEERERKEKIEQERLKQEEIISKKGAIEELETQAKILEQEKKQAQETADALFKEANERLKLAIKKNDLPGIRIAQGMLEGAEKLRQKEREQESKETKLNKIVNKRKSCMIDAFITKKPKIN